MPHSASSPAPSRPHRWRAGWEIALVFGLFFVAGGDPVPGVNEPHYLCRLKHAVDPDFCPRDFFLASRDAHVTFVVAFAWLTTFLSVETIAWGGRLATWLALAWGWWRLSWTIVPRPMFAVLGGAIIVTGINEGNFAGEWMIGGFEAKCLAYVFVLLALRALVVGNWNWVWIHLGIATAWHALVGGWSVLIHLWIWWCGGRGEAPFRQMLPALLLGGIVGLVGVLPALWLSLGEPAEVSAEAAQIYVFDRLAHHLSPFSKAPEWIANRIGRHAAIVSLMAVLLVARWLDLGRQGSRLAADPAGRVALFACGAMGLAVTGAAIEFALGNHPDLAARFLRYYWFRMSDVAVPIAAAVLASAFLAPRLAAGSRMAAVLAGVLALLCGLHLTGLVWERSQAPIPPSDRKMEHVADWIEVCEWCRANTSPDSLFLTPRNNQTFKWRAERSEVVNYKDVPQDAESLLEWKRRMDDVFRIAGAKGLPMPAGLGQLGTERIRELANKYGFEYVVTTGQYPLDLPVEFRNATYVVYRIR